MKKAANHNFQSLPKHPFWQAVAQFFLWMSSEFLALTRSSTDKGAHLL